MDPLPAETLTVRRKDKNCSPYAGTTTLLSVCFHRESTLYGLQQLDRGTARGASMSREKIGLTPQIGLNGYPETISMHPPQIVDTLRHHSTLPSFPFAIIQESAPKTAAISARKLQNQA